MKKIGLTLLGLLLVGAAYAKDIQELVVTTTPPMSCQNCENKIKGNLRFEKGIKKIETNIPDQRVTIEYDADKTNPEKIEDAFKKIGYKVEVIGADYQAVPTVCPETQEAATGCSGNCCQGNAASCEK